MDSQLQQQLAEHNRWWLQALLFLPQAQQPATGWLWLLLDDMLQTALLPTQSSNARLNLSWWQEQLRQPGDSGHPGLRTLKTQRPDLPAHPAWPHWFDACQQLLNQPAEQALTLCHKAWQQLEAALADHPHPPCEPTAAILACEQALAQQRNRVRFGLPGHSALAALPPRIWQQPAATGPEWQQADTLLRHLAARALELNTAAHLPAATALRLWLARQRLRQWQIQGLNAYNGLRLSPWRSLLGFWLTARRHRSRQ